MKKLEAFLEKWLLPIGRWVNGNGPLTVLQNAMVALVPITISGSVALIIMYFPFIDDVLPASFLVQLRDILSPIVDITLGLISVYVVAAIAYYFARHYKTSKLYTEFVGLASFLILTPFVVEIPGGEALYGVIPTDYLGSAGMFVAILSTFLSCYLYRALVDRKITIKLPEMVPPNVSASFTALIPMVITLLVMVLVRYGFSLTSYGDVNNLIYTVLQAPLTGIGTGLVPTIIVVIMIQLFWFVGLHGINIVGSIMGPIWLAATTANAAAYAAGEALPYIVTDEFITIFIVPQFLALIIAILIFGKKGSGHSEIAKASFPAGIFNISEPVVFGLPIVLNVMTVIPWILVMIVFAVTSYLSMQFGIVPKPIGVVIPWTTPPIISGFLATNSIMGALLQAFNLFVGVIIWLPFIKIMNKQAESALIDQEEE